MRRPIEIGQQTLVEKEASIRLFSPQTVRTVTNGVFSRGSGGDPRLKPLVAVREAIQRARFGRRGFSPGWPGQSGLKGL